MQNGDQIQVGDLFKKRADEFLSEGAAGQKMIAETYELLAKSYTKQRQWEQDVVTAFPQLMGKKFNYDAATGNLTIIGDMPAPPEVPQPVAEAPEPQPDPADTYIEPPCGGRPLG